MKFLALSLAAASVSAIQIKQESAIKLAQYDTTDADHYEGTDDHAGHSHDYWEGYNQGWEDAHDSMYDTYGHDYDTYHDYDSYGHDYDPYGHDDYDPYYDSYGGDHYDHYDHYDGYDSYDSYDSYEGDDHHHTNPFEMVVGMIEAHIYEHGAISKQEAKDLIQTLADAYNVTIDEHTW